MQGFLILDEGKKCKFIYIYFLIFEKIGIFEIYNPFYI